jgi:hypothetical protein
VKREVCGWRPKRRAAGGERGGKDRIDARYRAQEKARGGGGGEQRPLVVVEEEMLVLGGFGLGVSRADHGR